MSEEEKKKEKKETPKAKPTPKVEPTRFENATKVAELKLLKLYDKMPDDETVIYTGPEVAKAIGLDPENKVDVQAVSLVWHRLYDEGKVGVPQFTRPPSAKKAKKPELPVI